MLQGLSLVVAMVLGALVGALGGAITGSSLARKAHRRRAEQETPAEPAGNAGGNGADPATNSHDTWGLGGSPWVVVQFHHTRGTHVMVRRVDRADFTICAWDPLRAELVQWPGDAPESLRTSVEETLIHAAARDGGVHA